MTKTLYIAPVPSESCISTAKDAWKLLSDMNPMSVEIKGVQTYEDGNYSILSSPDEFKTIPEVFDYQTARAVAGCIIRTGYLDKDINRRQIMSESLFGFIRTNATTFGLAIDSCGCIGAQLQYSYLRVASANEPVDAIKRMRECFNINILTSSNIKYNINAPLIIARAAKTFVETNFEGTEAQMKRLKNTHSFSQFWPCMYVQGEER
jgi:hypothetical protein